MSNESTEIRIWERLPDGETQRQYNLFAKFYLNQELPRSIMGAYRRYRADKLGLSLDDEQIAGISNLPSTWRRMAYAYNKKDKRIESMPTWVQRAAAYDAHRNAKLRMMTEQLQIEKTFESLVTIDEMIARWYEMFRLVPALKKTGLREIPVKVVDADGNETTEYEVVEIKALNTGQYGALVKQYDMLREMQRRELNQPGTIRQQNLADNEGGEFSVLGKGLTDVMTGTLQEIQEWKKQKREGGEDSD